MMLILYMNQVLPLFSGEDLSCPTSVTNIDVIADHTDGCQTTVFIIELKYICTTLQVKNFHAFEFNYKQLFDIHPCDRR